MRNWSEDSRRICRQIAESHPQATGKELRRLFSDAYPYGPRAYWPYKAWLTACRREIDARDGKPTALRPRYPGEAASVDPRQMALFEEAS